MSQGEEGQIHEITLMWRKPIDKVIEIVYGKQLKLCSFHAESK